MGNRAVWCASHHCLGVAASSAMLGPGRIGTRGILRGINQARDGRHLSVLASQATQATQASRSPVLPTASLLYQNPVVRRSIFTTRVLGDEVKVVVCPAFADSISEGDLRWEKAVGDTVSEDEVLCEIETDKTSVPVPSPGSGVITELLVEDGTTVQPGAQLLKIQLGPGGAKPAAAPAPAAPAPAAAAPPPPPPPPAAAPAPVAATAAPIPITPPPPPPRPAAPLAARPPPPPMPPRAPAAGAAPVLRMPPADPTTEIAGTRSEHRVKMNRMRMKIASRLKDAQNTNAMLTSFNELDMSAIMQLRKDNQDAFVKKHGIKMGFMSAFVKASAYALTKQPTVNAVIEGQETVYRDFVDISVAVATPKGLVVPVLRNVEKMNYFDIEHGINELGKKAREGNLTISNGGVFKSLFGTPIINQPQSAILGMHGVFDRPVAINGKVEIRPMMYVALTYDHRVIDGRDAVTFLRNIKECVEEPAQLLINL